MWKNSEIENLILLVRNNRLLYDKQAKHYKLKDKTDEAWGEVAISLKTKTAKQCKEKWTNLRQQQRRIFRKSYENQPFVRWHFHDSMKFLNAHMQDYKSDEESTLPKHEFEHLIHAYKSEQGDLVKQEYKIANNMNEQNFSNYTQDTIQDRILMSDNPSIIETRQTVVTNNIQQQQHSNNDLFAINTNSQIYNSPTSTNQTNFKILPQTPHINDTNSNHQHEQTAQHHQQTQPTSNNICSNNCNSNNLLYLTKMNELLIKQIDIQNNTTTIGHFLCDISKQMDKLNDIAQIEVKIDIQKLILDKLKCKNNLRSDYQSD